MKQDPRQASLDFDLPPQQPAQAPPRAQPPSHRTPPMSAPSVLALAAGRKGALGGMPIGELDASAPETAFALALAARLARLAQGRGAAPDDVALLEKSAAALGRAVALGHVCLPLPPLARRLELTPQALRAALLRSTVVAPARRAGQGEAGDASPLVIDAMGRLYLARHDDDERRLAQALLRLATPPAEPLNGAAMRALLAQGFALAAGADGVDWQRLAAALALDARLMVISGGPGTGKTTTVAGLLACLLAREPDLRVALAAPTGKAAQRMLEALAGRAASLPAAASVRFPDTSFTLHRLLGSLPDGRFRHHRGAPLPYDLVIVDEASMIDLTMAARLLDALPPRARLVLLGDKDQLSAVEAGAVFAELSARPVLRHATRARLAEAFDVAPECLMQGPSLGPGDAWPLADTAVWLERNYRFHEDSPIGRLAVAVRDGAQSKATASLSSVDAAGLGRCLGEASGEAACWLLDESATLPAAVLNALSRGYQAYFDSLQAWREGERTAADLMRLFEAFNRFRILCAVREGTRGTRALNAAVAARVQARGTSPATRWPGEWFDGRAVMIARNDYALRLFNGDIGIALAEPKGSLRVAFPAAGGVGFRTLSPAALPPLDTAFAMTVHKSQGSEFESAALVLPPAGALSRELVYTGITRAKQRIALIASRAALEQAVDAPSVRDSGLLDRLRALAGDASAAQAEGDDALPGRPD